MSTAAGLTDNRSILAKADLALSDLQNSAGLLQPAQAAKFMQVMIKASKVLGMSTFVPMRSPKQLIEKIRFGGRVLRGGSEAQALPVGDRAKPDLTKVELDAKLFKAEVRLDNEVLEDSIEKSELRQTVMQLMGEAIARDVEEVVVRGDTTSLDPFLAKMDGIVRQATSHSYDALLQGLNKTVFRDMLRLMPNEFLRDLKMLCFCSSVNSVINYRDSLGDRQTPGGDRMLMENQPAYYSGIKVEDIPLFPEDLGIGQNATNCLLTDMKNVNVGMWRNIRIETDKLVSEGVLIIVASIRFDVKYAVEDAVVKATNIKTST